MWWFDCVALGVFLLTVGAENQDVKSDLTEETKDTDVMKQWLSLKENAVDHGTEALPANNAHQHITAAVTAEFLWAVLFETRPAQANERISVTKVTDTESTEYFPSRNVKKLLNSSVGDSEGPLSSNSEKISSSTQAAIELVLNDTSEPQVHLSAVAAKAPPWFHPRHDGRNHRNANSVTLTSADAGLGVPILSASHPGVIDNPAAWLNDTDDKRSQGMGITDPGRNVYTMQSILQNDLAEDSKRENTVTDLCLTCLKDGKAASAEKSAALAAVSPNISSDSPSTEGLGLELNQFMTSLHFFHHPPAGQSKEVLIKEIRKGNTSTPSLSGRGELIYNQTYLPFIFNKTVNHSFLNNSQSKTFFSVRETVLFDTRSVTETSSVTQNLLTKQRHDHPRETSVTQRLNLTTTESVNDGEQEVLSKNLSSRNPQSKLRDFIKSHKNTSYDFNTNLKNLDISNVSVNITPKTPPTSYKSILPKGAASHPTARINLTEARGAKRPFSLDSPTASAVKNLKSHFQTPSTDSSISLLRSQIRSELSSQTNEPISALQPKDSTVKFASETERYVTEKQDSQISATGHGVVKHSFVNPPSPSKNTVMKDQQTSTFSTIKAMTVEFFASTKPSSVSFTKKLTETQSKISQERAFNGGSANMQMSKSHQSLQDVHSLKLEDQSEQDFTVVADKEDNNFLKTEGNPSGEIQRTEEARKLQDEEWSREDETLENKRKELLGLDKTESAKQEKIINSGAEINRNTDREAEKMEERAAKASREEHVTLRQDKDPRQGEVSEEEYAKRKGVTKINTEDFTQEAEEVQGESSEEKGAEEQSSREDMKCNKDIVKEDMKNVPLEHTADWKELNKEHTVENLSSCHSLIKELKTTEHKGIHLSENTSQRGKVTNKSFSYKVTSNHQPPHLSQRSQRPKQSETTFPPEKKHTGIAMHLSTHKAVLPKQGATLPLTAAASRKEEVVSSEPASSKRPHSSGTSALKFRDILKTCRSPLSSSAKSANMLSLTTPLLAVTTGFQGARPHTAVNTSLNESIIHSITDHRHKFNTSVSRAGTVVHVANEKEAEYIRPSMNPAQHQQMYNDSSTKPPTVAALSSVAHVSLGQWQPHQGQPAAQRSQSSACSDMTLGLPRSLKLSEQTSHPDTLQTPADDNKQRFFQALMPPMSPEVEIDQPPLRRMSPVLNVSASGGDSSLVTYELLALEEKSLQANFDSEHTDSRSHRAEALLATADEANKSVRLMVTSEAKRSAEETDGKHSSSLQPPETDGSNQHANNTGELRDLNADRENDVNNAKRYHQFQFGDTTSNTEKPLGVETVPALLDQTGTAAFLESGITDVLDTFTEKQDNQSPSRHTANDNTLSTPHINFNSYLTIHSKFTQMTADTIRTAASRAQILKATTDVSTKGFESLITTIESVPVTKKSSLALVEHKAQSNDHTEPQSLRGFLTTSTPGKPTPVSKSTKTIQTQSVQQPEQKISEREAEQSQRDPLAMTAISRPIKATEPGVRAGFSKMAHRAGRAHGQTSAAVERMRYSSFKDVKSALTTSAVEAKRPSVEEVSSARTQDRRENKKDTQSGKTSISQTITGAMTDSVPPAGITPTEVINKTSCRTIGCAKSGGTTKTTSGAGVIAHTGEMYEVHSAFAKREHFMAENRAHITSEHDNLSSDLSVPGKATPQAISIRVLLSPVTSKVEHGCTSAADSGLKKAKRTSDKTVHVEGQGASQWAALVMKTTQRRFHGETSGAQEAGAREATLSEPEAATEKTTVKSAEQTLLTERNTKTQLDRRAGKVRIFEVQNASRSQRAHAKEETAGPESGSRLLLSELNQKRRTSPHLYLPGVTEISDDLCGSGNYTAEMSLKLGGTVEPGDAVPARGNLRVVINLKTNNSQINLGVTSCCLSPTTQPDLTNSTCCLFSRLAAQPSGITLLPSALSTSASFTISLFQMINYSVVYLHCDLSVCLRNHSDCERQCFQQRSSFPSHGTGTIVANLRNRISFGPMLKQAKNSTFPKEIELSELDLVLVVVSLMVGFCLVTVMALLVWLAYRRRAIWLLRSAAPPQSCCGCLRPGGDLILP